MQTEDIERPRGVLLTAAGRSARMPPLVVPPEITALASAGWSRRPYYPRSYFMTDHISGLERIFRDEVSLGIWRRERDRALEHYLTEWLPGKPIERVARVEMGALQLSPLLCDLPDRPVRAQFAGELARLVELLATLSDCESVGVRLCITQGTPCPRFHVDWVGLRLISTWRGAGTEWVEHQAVDRSRLGIQAQELRDEESGLLLPGAQIHRMAAFDVGIFKGELWPNNAGRGVVHRSPKPDDPGQWRLMVSIDALN